MVVEKIAMFTYYMPIRNIHFGIKNQTLQQYTKQALSHNVSQHNQVK